MKIRSWRRPLIDQVNDHLIEYQSPTNLSYAWGFGSLAGICLIIQIITGIFLAMHYTPHIDYAFASIEHIMRDVNYGWLLRYAHANGASMFFIVVYVHIFRGLYYGSYSSPRQFVWVIGVIILLVMILTSFLGYVLPWGQMSFWAATVITNLFSAIPLIGESIVSWLWGGFSVDNATLNRFYSLHYLLPFVLAALAGVHLLILHMQGSGNPLGISTTNETLNFYPYFYVKDLVGGMVFFIVYGLLVFFAPNLLGHPDNYIVANPLVTPTHIVPEWYFLPYYAILRAIPDKLGGVIAMAGSIISLAVLPFLHFSKIRSSYFRPLFQITFWYFVVNCFILGWIGGNVPEAPYILIGQLSTAFYFLYIFVIVPGTGLLENCLYENINYKNK